MKSNISKAMAVLLLITYILTFSVFFTACCEATEEDIQTWEAGKAVLINDDGARGSVEVWHDKYTNVCYISHYGMDSRTLSPWLKADGSPMIWGVDWPMEDTNESN